MSARAVRVAACRSPLAAIRASRCATLAGLVRAGKRTERTHAHESATAIQLLRFLHSGRPAN